MLREHYYGTEASGLLYFRNMENDLTMPTIIRREAVKQRPRVADIVARFCRQKNFAPVRTYGDVIAEKITELSGDEVALDRTEEVLVSLKRKKVISGRRLVTLLGQHRRETRG